MLAESTMQSPMDLQHMATLRPAKQTPERLHLTLVIKHHRAHFRLQASLTAHDHWLLRFFLFLTLRGLSCWMRTRTVWISHSNVLERRLVCTPVYLPQNLEARLSWLAWAPRFKPFRYQPPTFAKSTSWAFSVMPTRTQQAFVCWHLRPGMASGLLFRRLTTWSPIDSKASIRHRVHLSSQHELAMMTET